MPSATITTTTSSMATSASTKKSHPPSTNSQNSHKTPISATTNGLNAKNTAYSRWRPSYHLIAPQGWLNDPCAPGYAPSTGRYHVGFQWNPKGAEWGDVVWGKAFSSDLVTWEVCETPSLERDAPYDHAGVFTGCWRPTGLDGRHEKGATGESSSPGEVSLIYTSVSRLPIHYTKAYHRGCETLSLATSQDGGKTWAKDHRNPILPGPPEGVDALGWRDPYVAEWPAMAKMLKSQAGGGTEEKEPLFGLISGGIRNKTATTWLYKIDAQDLTKWDFVGPLVKPGANFAPSRWTGDIGVNWEVTNFVSLTAGREDKVHQDFLIFGAEGCKPPYGGAGVAPGTKRTNRAQLWIAVDPADDAEGTISSSQQPGSVAGASPPDQKPLMKFSYGGIFDHGLYYAANGFWDPVSQQQIVFGWVTEEDIPISSQVKQGWSGCLSLPRVISLVTIPHVVRASKSAPQDITSIKVTKAGEANNTFTVQTLGIKPDARLQKLRAGATASALAGAPHNAIPMPLRSGASKRLSLKTARWEAYAEFAKVGSSGCKRVGIKIHHASPPPSSTTTSTSSQPVTVLCFAPEEETIVIERPDIFLGDANNHPGLACTGTKEAKEEGWPAQLQNDVAPFTLFTSLDTQAGGEQEERLKVHVFYDGSVVEMFVNERVAITTRVYLEDQRCSELEFFADSEDGCVLEQAAVWDGLSV